MRISQSEATDSYNSMTDQLISLDSKQYSIAPAKLHQSWKKPSTDTHINTYH